MKLGILGTGMIVQDFLHTVEKLDFEKVVILGTEQYRELTEKLVETYHLDGAFYDYQALLDSDVDTVYVGLPNFLHYSFAKQALERGKNAIIEKPITSNVRELEDLMQVAEKHHAMMFEGINFYYNPVFHHLQEDVKKLGKIRIVSLNYSQYSSRYDAFKAGEVLPAFDWRKSGGSLMDINLYNVNTVVRLFGLPEDLRYMANMERKIDTSGALLLRYPEFVAVCIGSKDSKASTLSTIQGDLGTIEITLPPNLMTGYRINYVNGETETVDVRMDEHRLYNEFRTFKSVVDSGDYTQYRQMIQKSLDVARVLEQARKQENIFFAADEEAAGR